MVIIIVLKPESIRPESRVRMVNYSGQHKTKIIIIIILKLDLRVNSGQDPSHRLESLIWVDLSQYNDKNCYYHNFKILLGGRPRQDSGHKSRGSTRVTQDFFKKNYRSNLVLTNFFKNSQQVFNPCFFPGWLGFLTRSGQVNPSSIFFKLEPLQALGQTIKSILVL